MDIKMQKATHQQYVLSFKAHQHARDFSELNFEMISMLLIHDRAGF